MNFLFSVVLWSIIRYLLPVWFRALSIRVSFSYFQWIFVLSIGLIKWIGSNSSSVYLSGSSSGLIFFICEIFQTFGKIFSQAPNFCLVALFTKVVQAKSLARHLCAGVQVWDPQENQDIGFWLVTSFRFSTLWIVSSLFISTLSMESFSCTLKYVPCFNRSPSTFNFISF